MQYMITDIGMRMLAYNCTNVELKFIQHIHNVTLIVRLIIAPMWN